MKIEQMPSEELLRSYEATCRSDMCDEYAIDCLRQEIRERLMIAGPFVYGEVIDNWVNWPLGRAERLARKGKLPHVVLPDGAIRFQKDSIGLLMKVVEANSEDAMQIRDATEDNPQ